MFWVLTFVALSVLIIVHEAGHYFVARWSGMRVEKFSLGFGPAILKWKWKGTQFQLAPIFFGGFVQITGMNPHEEYDEKDPAVYPNRPALLRFLTIFAGPFTNILFSSVLVFIVLVVAGREIGSGRNVIGDLSKGAPAEGLLEPGDIVETVDGVAVSFERADFRQQVQKSGGAPITIKLLRKDEEKLVTLTPKKDHDAWVIGVVLQAEKTERVALSLGDSAVRAVKYPFDKSKLILGGLWDIVTGKAPADAVGVVGMASMIHDVIVAGWVRAFEFLALLNVYLGLFNLLPIPALDGGRLVFLGYELATRRRPNPKVETAVHMAGFLVLIVLILLVNFKDILHWRR